LKDLFGSKSKIFLSLVEICFWTSIICLKLQKGLNGFWKFVLAYFNNTTNKFLSTALVEALQQQCFSNKQQKPFYSINFFMQNNIFPFSTLLSRNLFENYITKQFTFVVKIKHFDIQFELLNMVFRCYILWFLFLN
jgi:hypothetical protein